MFNGYRQGLAVLLFIFVWSAVYLFGPVAPQAEAAPGPDLTITEIKTDGPFRQGLEAYGDLASYTITVQNIGDASSSGLAYLTVDLPAGMTVYTFVQYGDWSCQLGSPFKCTLYGSMGPGAVVSIQAFVSFGRDVPLSVTSTATLSGGGDVNTDNDSQQLTTAVEDVQYAPTLNAIDPQQSLEGDTVSLQVVASDWDHEPLDYAAAGLPDGVAIDAATGLISGALDYVSAGSYSVTVTVKDPSNRTDAKSFTWEVEDYNRPPVFTAASANTVQTIQEDQGMTALEATDADGDLLAYTLASGELPEGIALNTDGSFSGKATAQSSDLYQPIIEVTDGVNTVQTSMTVTVINMADLSITMSHAGNFRLGQAGAVYTIVVSNAADAGDTIGDVTVTDLLSAGDFEAVDLSGDGWSCDLASLTCVNTGVIAGGQSYEPIMLIVNVKPEAGTETTNRAVLSGGGDITPDNNETEDPTSIDRLPDLAIEMALTGAGLREGGTGTYKIRVSNAGTLASSGQTTVKAIAPTGLTVTGMSGSDWDCSLADLTCVTTSVIGIGEYASDIVVNAEVSADTGDHLTMEAQVAYGDDPVEANNHIAVTTPVEQAADLTLALSHSGAFRQGGSGEYHFVVTNTGQGSTNADVTITDPMPQGLTARSYTGAGWDCSLNETVICTRTDVLAPGASYPELVVEVDIDEYAPVEAENTAQVSGGGEANITNNSAMDAATILQNSDLTATITPVGVFAEGQTGSMYAIQVANVGTGQTSGPVMIHFSLPAGVSATGIIADNWNCDLNAFICERSDPLPRGDVPDLIRVQTAVAESIPELPAVFAVQITAAGDVDAGNDEAQIQTPLVPALRIDENNPVHASVGLLTTDSRLFSLVPGQGDDSFELLDSELFARISLDYEATNGTIPIRVRDETGYEQSLLVVVADGNDAPTGLSLSSASIEEELPAGSVVGQWSSDNQEPDETLTYQLVAGVGSDDNADFSIEEDRLLTARKLDFEAQPTYAIRVRVTDTAGHTFEAPFVISVRNINDNAPTAADIDFATSFQTIGYGALNGHDADGDELTYSVVKQGDKGTLTLLNAVAGQFSYQPFQGQSGADTVTYVVYDGLHPAATASVRISIASPPADDSGAGSGGGNANPVIPSSDGKLTLPPGSSGQVSLGKELVIVIPAAASDRELKLTIEKVSDAEEWLAGLDTMAAVSPVYEILKNFTDNFKQPVTLTFVFDPAKLKLGQRAAVFYYDEAKKNWVEVSGGKTDGDRISVQVDHFTKFAVFAVNPDSDTAEKEEPSNEGTPVIRFTDISGHWAETAILQAVNNSIVKGYPDGSFRPDAVVTRAEFTVMLAGVLKLEDEGKVLSFTDSAKIGSWARAAVARAVHADIIRGFEDGSFKPDRAITRAEMAIMVASALGLPPNPDIISGFKDSQEVPRWAQGAVAELKQRGILQGDGDNRFHSTANATRAEAVTILLKIQGLQP